jgi:hypothetical protein
MFKDFLKKLDRQQYPFLDGLYYLFIILLLVLMFIFFA